MPDGSDPRTGLPSSPSTSLVVVKVMTAWVGKFRRASRLLL